MGSMSPPIERAYVLTRVRARSSRPTTEPLDREQYAHSRRDAQPATPGCRARARRQRAGSAPSARRIAIDFVAPGSEHVHHARDLALPLELLGVCHGSGMRQPASPASLVGAVHEEDRVARLGRRVAGCGPRDARGQLQTRGVRRDGRESGARRASYGRGDGHACHTKHSSTSPLAEIEGNAPKGRSRSA
jgi:hypothetical protein